MYRFNRNTLNDYYLEAGQHNVSSFFSFFYFSVVGLLMEKWENGFVFVNIFSYMDEISRRKDDDYIIFFLLCLLLFVIVVGAKRKSNNLSSNITHLRRRRWKKVIFQRFNHQFVVICFVFLVFVIWFGWSTQRRRLYSLRNKFAQRSKIH